jgi:hypothetical protein
MDFVAAVELRDPRLTEFVFGQIAFEVGFLSLRGQRMGPVGMHFQELAAL